MNEIDTVAQRRPSLVADAEINRLVRQFASRVLFMRAAWHSGDDGAQNPLPAIESDARAASAAVALTPYGRAMFMYLLPEETKAFADPAAGLFMWIASQTVQMMQAIEDGGPEDAIKPKIDAMLTDVVDRLTGEKY
ncbi:hypothetical protein SAMN05444172_1603 [Burkholderia sp. GAS332]|nr:hypothetical protein SAMN05444172_1603 [Burkholderia sp. GAS332]